MKGNLVRLLVTSLLFLPASCACGAFASGIQSERLSTETTGGGGQLWLENLLWLGALALMLLWARQVKRLSQPTDNKTSVEEN